jgi:hypothetical protein
MTPPAAPVRCCCKPKSTLADIEQIMQAFDSKADVAQFKSGSGCEWLTLQILPTYCKQQTCRAVNTAMLQTYWQVGQRIVEEEQQGQALISKLSRYLGDQFGQGFSVLPI